MHEVEKHIRSLLVVENSVSLPGIGGFIKQYKEADISKLKKNITPPLKTVAFNKYLGEENDLLLNRLMEQEKISEEEARKKLNTYLEELRKKLEESGHAEIEGVGKLEKSPSGEIQFVSFIPEHELADNFGLSLLEIDVPEKSVETEKTAEAESAGKVELPKQPVMQTTTNTSSQRNYTALLVIAIVIVLLAPLAYYVVVKTDMFQATSKNSLVEDVEREVEQIEQEQKRYADSVDQELERSLNALTQKGSALKPDDKSDDYYDQFDRFYLVAGSFKNREFAERLRKNLVQKGYNEAEIISSNGFFRVTITSYTNRKLALDRLEELRRDYNSKVWVLSI